MKFQDCILKKFKQTHERTDGWMDGRTDERKDRPKAICPFNFSKVGGIKIKACFKFRASEATEEKNLYFYRVNDILE